MKFLTVTVGKNLSTLISLPSIIFWQNQAFYDTLSFHTAAISLLLAFYQQLSALLPETNVPRSHTKSNINQFEGRKKKHSELNYHHILYLKIKHTYATRHSSSAGTGNGQSGK